MKQILNVIISIMTIGIEAFIVFFLVILNSVKDEYRGEKNERNNKKHDKRI